MNEEHFSLRDVAGGYMHTLGVRDNRVLVVNSDLMGTCRNRTFCEAFPERTFNVGIAEANMISFSAGLAHEGFLPYAFTMAPFMSMRACEQVRTDVAYSGLNVRLVAPYSGYSGGISGATHWAIEDCAIFTSIPGMTILEPCDPYETTALMDLSLSNDGPMYYRISVEPVGRIYSEDESFEIGKAKIVRHGNDGAFLVAGVVVGFAFEAAERIFAKTGKEIRVVDMFSLKPIDRNAVVEAANTSRVVVAQDHNVIGGLGWAVSSIIAEEGIQTDFSVLGCVDKFIPMAHAPYLYHKYGYDADGLEASMLSMLEK